MKSTYLSRAPLRSALAASVLVMCGALVMPATASAAGAAQTATPDMAAILGADTNNNGVRDDLEAFLAANFSKNERVFRSLSNMVISLHYALKSSTKAESGKAYSMTLRSQECMISLGQELLPYKNALEKMDTMLLNTAERLTAYQEHSGRIADMNFAVINAPEWDDGCLKRVDQQ